jgi:hypothetical protein
MRNFREILAGVMIICGLALVLFSVVQAETFYIWADRFWVLSIFGTVLCALAFPVAGERPFQKIADSIDGRLIRKFSHARRRK